MTPLDIERMTLDQIRVLAVEERWLTPKAKPRIIHMQPYELERMGIIPPQGDKSAAQIAEQESRHETR